MSSSKKKQLRKEQYMTDRQAAAAQEAKKLKRYTLTFWVVIALVVCIFVGAVSLNPVKNVLYKHADAVQVGDHTLSAVELNYFYINAISNYQTTVYNQYYSILGNSWSLMMGFDTTKALDEQIYDKEKGTTWADYFLEDATTSIKGTYALYDLAVKEKHELTEEEKSSIESELLYTQLYATTGGYSSVDAYLRAIYGNGATEESYRAYLETTVLATSYLSAYSESLKFTDEQLNDFQKDEPFKYNSYTYAYCYLTTSSFLTGGTKDDKGNTTYSDEEKQAAIDAAKQAADALAAGKYADLSAFEEAVKDIIVKEKAGTFTATKKENVLYASVGSLFQDWLTGKTAVDGAEDKYEYLGRTEGDLTIIPSTTGTGDDEVVNGYYVVRFGSVTDNKQLLKDIRHILISCTGTEQDDGSIKFTDETAAAKAKETAEKILEEFKKNPTEENFKTLSETYLKDKTAYEATECPEVYPNMMVSQFNDWCFDEARQTGDCEIVATRYGYHLIYFVGNSDIDYRTYMITEDLRIKTRTDWYTALRDDISVSILTSKYVEMDKVLDHNH